MKTSSRYKPKYKPNYKPFKNKSKSSNDKSYAEKILPAMEELAKETRRKEKEDRLDGLWCTSCGDFSTYAEPNQEDGTFVCWSCRN
jgi:hypothetical protein